MAENSNAARIVLFLEDPGAVAYLTGLEAELTSLGFEPVLLVAGNAHKARPDGRTVAETDAGDILAEIEPVAVVGGTSENLDTFAFDLFRAARQNGIPSFGAVDSAANAAYRFRGRTTEPFAHAPDRLLVPDRATCEAFVALGFARDRITITGHPRLDELAARTGDGHMGKPKGELFPLAGDRPVIVFVSELSTGLGENPFRRTPDWTLTGDGDSDRRTDVVAQEFVSAARRLASNPWLVLRLHPKQDPADAAAIASRFDQVSQLEPGMDIVGSADLVTGMTSILLNEAAVMGRPVLSIVPDPAERAWLGDLGERMACVWTRESLEAALADWPAPLPPSWTGLRPPKTMALSIIDAIAQH